MIEHIPIVSNYFREYKLNTMDKKLLEYVSWNFIEVAHENAIEYCDSLMLDSHKLYLYGYNIKKGNYFFIHQFVQF
ncbi:MAG: hypothetical protein PWP63_1625 [Methanolobus sp.]|nr:hypothetical protein [Methanolobus sp.]